MHCRFFNTFSSHPKDEDDETSVSNKVQLTFWRNYGNPAENKAYEDIVSAFEALHPNIMIDMKLIPYSDYELKLRTESAAGTPPDIMAIDSPNLALYANAGALLSLDQYMKKRKGILRIFLNLR
ncbi:hypothetical protein GCM10020331_102640 [Ectobacillus funiculus]